MEGVREFRGGNLQAEGIMDMGNMEKTEPVFNLTVVIAVTFLFLAPINFV